MHLYSGPCVCSTLRRAARAVTAQYDGALAATGLTVTQYALLSRINRAGALPLTDLAAAMGMDRTTLTRTLLPIEREGWVHSVSATDRRQRVLQLTAAGKARFEAAYPVWAATQKTMVRKLGKARWET